MEFKRENRYLVLKRSDIDRALTIPDQTVLFRLAELIHTNRKVYGKRPFACAVVESDWPEYEPTWGAIQRRMEGRPTLLEEKEAEFDTELGRWQQAIYELVKECSGADSEIDGAGCDSGDPLDFTLTEIQQGFAHIQNRCYDALCMCGRQNEIAEGETALDVLFRCVDDDNLLQSEIDAVGTDAVRLYRAIEKMLESPPLLAEIANEVLANTDTSFVPNSNP